MGSYPDVPWDNLVIPIGSTVRHSWFVDDADTGEPADFTGWTGLCRVSDSLGGSGLISTATILAADGSGNLTIEFSDEATTALTPRRYGYFAVELTDPADKVWRVVEGNVLITADPLP